MNGIRVALALLTVAPVGRPPLGRSALRAAMLLAPLVGVIVGLLAAIVVAAAGRVGLSSLTGAVLAVSALAGLTRGLHLDGLADLADGLGSRRSSEGALEVMRRSDIGAFGVVTVVLVVLLQVAALVELAGSAYVALPVAAMTGRTAATLACRRGVPAARADGLGRLVAGLVPGPAAVLDAGVVLVVGTAASGFAGWGVAPGLTAGAAGLAAGLLLERHARRRLGGITGDVLGALVETGTTVALVVLAAGAGGE